MTCQQLCDPMRSIVASCFGAFFEAQPVLGTPVAVTAAS